MTRPARRLFAALLFFLTTYAALGDIGSIQFSSDFDAEFARAADLLETGHREQAQQILEQILRQSARPAWVARVDFLLAADDERVKDFAAAAGRLKEAPATEIGLEPYKRIRLARVLSAAGHREEAIAQYRAAFETDEPFALRVAAARRLAALLEEQGEAREAARVLSRAAALASLSEAVPVAVERIRLALAAHEAQAVAAAARDLLLSGLDPAAGVPAFAQRALREEEMRLSPAERGRLGAALVGSGDFRRGVGFLEQDSPSLWPASDYGRNLLALARGHARMKRAPLAERIAARVPEDGSAVFYEAKLFRADLMLARLRGKSQGPLSADDPRVVPASRTLRELTVEPVPVFVRASARERLLRLACDADRFDEALEEARALTRESPGAVSGFEPLWRLAWAEYLRGDYSGARRRFETLSGVYEAMGFRRRLTYWRARCLEREGRAAEAAPLFESLAHADPADLYALFARGHVTGFRVRRLPPVADPSTATATFRRSDELLRLRMFEEAAAEAAALPASRGRDLRLAEAQFALGNFSSAAAAAKRAFPQIGTAEEGEVPDGWRRLYYPIETGGFLAERAREFALDPAILRGLVRQESFFDASAKSRAGALGLTQLLPSTALSVARSVLRVRYRRAFLYDPSFNARLGAAYLRHLYDSFNGNSVFALAAYNGGPTRMARLLEANTGRQEDELFESHPAYESRDYVRRVMLFAETYRTLYPGS